MTDGRDPTQAPVPWHHYRLDADTDDPQVALVIGETVDFVWCLDVLSGDQWDESRPDFEDGLDDGSIEHVRPAYEAVEAEERRTQGAGA